MSEGRSREQVMSIVVSEFVVMTTNSFLATARDDVHWKATKHWGVVERGGVLVTFNIGYYDHIGRSSFL